MAGSAPGQLPDTFEGIWQPGGALYEKYRQRIAQKLKTLVPQKETFSRAEVLVLCNRMRREGYATGYSAALARHKRRRLA